MSVESLILIASALILLLFSARLFVLIGFCTVLSSVLFLDDITWLGPQGMDFGESMRKITDKHPLLAIPFFVLSGSIMSRGAIADRLIGVARSLFSGIPGGLGIATVLACMFFAAISGSSPVTVITIGGVMYPALVAAGYSERFAIGLVTSAGTLGILIPPSIPMIIYGIFASEATTPIKSEELFLAGVGPGLLIGLFFSIYCFFVGWRRGERFKRYDEPILERLIEGVWSLMLPVIILGGIYSGLFTATEAAAVSVLYSVFVEVWVHRSLTFEDLPSVIGEATVLMGSLLVIFVMAVGLNDLITDLEIADQVVAWIKQQDLTPITFMLVLNLFLLLVGCVMDIMSAIMILVPLLAPMAVAYGIDPIHLGIVFIVNLELGYLTPPMGLNLFVSTSLFNKPLGTVIRSVLPTLALLALALVCVTYIPSIALGPLNLKEGRSVYVEFPSPDSEKTVRKSKVKSIRELMQSSDITEDEDLKALNEELEGLDDDDEDEDDDE